MEHSWDYAAIDVTNKVGATSCWLDPYRSLTMDYLGNRPEGHPQVESALMRLLDSGRDFGSGRCPTIYIENHDHRRFMLKAGGRPFWYLTQPYLIALFTSPGATLIYNGQEFGLDNDMPESGDERVKARPLDWKLLNIPPGQDVFSLYQRMIRIRQEHPGLRTLNFYPSGWDESKIVRDECGFGIDRANNIVVYHRWGDVAGGTEKLYIVLNFSGFDQDISFEVPSAGPWTELIGGGRVSAADGRLHVRIGSNWGAVYQQVD